MTFWLQNPLCLKWAESCVRLSCNDVHPSSIDEPRTATRCLAMKSRDAENEPRVVKRRRLQDSSCTLDSACARNGNVDATDKSDEVQKSDLTDSRGNHGATTPAGCDDGSYDLSDAVPRETCWIACAPLFADSMSMLQDCSARLPTGSSSTEPPSSSSTEPQISIIESAQRISPQEPTNKSRVPTSASDHYDLGAHVMAQPADESNSIIDAPVRTASPAPTVTTAAPGLGAGSPLMMSGRIWRPVPLHAPECCSRVLTDNQIGKSIKPSTATAWQRPSRRKRLHISLHSVPFLLSSLSCCRVLVYSGCICVPGCRSDGLSTPPPHPYSSPALLPLYPFASHVKVAEAVA